MPPHKLGIIGTGFIARGLAGMIRRAADFELATVLTRRSGGGLDGFQDEELVQDVEKFIDAVDIVVECSGHTLHATEVIDLALKAGKKVVTMNSEWHITVGSYFKDKGYVTEAEGDQAGCLAALHHEALSMGFAPLAYINVKGYLDLLPTRETMEFYSKKQGISLDQVTSFTDGSKVQVEQAHVANGLGLGITKAGLLGSRLATLTEAAQHFGKAAQVMGRPIADFVVTPEAPGAVFIICTHDQEQAFSLEYMKLGKGPFYILKKPYHLCHLEMLKTIRQVAQGASVLLDNGSLPSVSVATLAKVDLQPGQAISRGMGSFELRGECVRIAEAKGHLPIGLSHQLVMKRSVPAGQRLTMDDVDLPESLALTAWQDTEKRVCSAATA
jgi:predicted homoserine dehydrogenase-like protein